MVWALQYLALRSHPPGNNDLLFSNLLVKHLFPQTHEKPVCDLTFFIILTSSNYGILVNVNFPWAEAMCFSQGLGLEAQVSITPLWCAQKQKEKSPKVLDDVCCGVINIDDYRILLDFHLNFLAPSPMDEDRSHIFSTFAVTWSYFLQLNSSQAGQDCGGVSLCM